MPHSLFSFLQTRLSLVFGIKEERAWILSFEEEQAIFLYKVKRVMILKNNSKSMCLIQIEKGGLG